MDNIGVFDRSSELPTGGKLEQADATSWMGMYCLGMLTIALELAIDRSPYEDTASKFFEHFLYIADAMNEIGGISLWDEEDGFYYDAITFPDGSRKKMEVRSLVGLIPLLGVVAISPETIEKLPASSAAYSGSSTTVPTSSATWPAWKPKVLGPSDYSPYATPPNTKTAPKTSCAACSNTCSTKPNSWGHTASALSPSIIKTIPSSLASTATITPSSTNLPNLTTACLVATPTGAAPYGFRLTTSC